MHADHPPIPAWLSGRPRVGGLVVPWITPKLPDGRYVFGSIERAYAEHSLVYRLCGVCGHRFAPQRVVLLLRASDLPRECTSEPALHPQCAAYTAAACPMVNGTLATYRTTPIPGVPATANSSARRGSRSERWFSVWLNDYHIVVDQGHLAASFRGEHPLRIRPIPLPPQ